MELLCNDIGEELGFPVSYWVGGNMYDGTMHFVMGPDSVKFEDGELDPFKLAHPELSLQVALLSDKLKQLGYEPGEYRIRTLDCIC